MTVLEQLREIYFKATQATIADDFGAAIDLFKQLSTDEDREKAAVFMEGIAEMRKEWGAEKAPRPTGTPRTKAKKKSVGPAPRKTR